MISIKNIYWMLAYVVNYFDKDEINKVNSEEFENIYELFCTIFTRELSKQIKKGLNKEYLIIEEETSSLKGRILINESIKKNSQIKAKMVCSYDEYSNNSYLNKIIKTAGIYIIKSNKVRTKGKIKKLKSVLNFLGEIEEIDRNNINWNQINYTRNNKSYRLLINISRLIFDGLLVSNNDGNIEFRNFISEEKMPKLYEKFILEYYRFHYKQLNPSSLKVEWNIDTNNPHAKDLPEMKTDIDLCYDERILIIDAKYCKMYQNNSLYNKDTFESKHLYQIYTYVKNKDKNRTGKVSGMLLYAKTDDIDLIESEYIIDGNKFIIKNLDLNVEFEEVAHQLNEIADKFIQN